MVHTGCTTAQVKLSRINCVGVSRQLRVPVERSMEALNVREKNGRTGEEGAEPR